MNASLNPAEQTDRYYLTTEQRHALWQNEIAMFVVLALPFVVAAFWYGATIQMYGFNGQVTVPASVNRGIGLALLIAVSVTVGGALYLFVQPAAERVHNAQPVRGPRRASYALFEGFLVGLITFQSLADMPSHDNLADGAIAIGLALAAALLAYASMLSMVDIPRDSADTARFGGRVRGVA
jgi:hypothetical protein